MGMITLFSCGNRLAEKQDYMEIYQKYNQGEIEEVIESLHDYTKKYPENSIGWTFLGVVELQQDNDSIAEIAFNKALKIKPDIKQALTGLGVIYRVKGMYDKSEELYKKSLEIDPDFAEAFSSLIIIELLKNNSDKAVEYGEKAWGVDSSNGVTAANLSLAYHYNSNDELSKKFFQKAKDLGYMDADILELALTDKISLEELLDNKLQD